MKYRDLILFFVSILFLLSLGYTLGVDKDIWFIPLLLFIVMLIVIYTLWIKD